MPYAERCAPKNILLPFSGWDYRIIIIKPSTLKGDIISNDYYLKLISVMLPLLQLFKAVKSCIFINKNFSIILKNTAFRLYVFTKSLKMIKLSSSPKTSESYNHLFTQKYILRIYS
ncbi:MAG: hypothetical protein CVV49_07655 [Spirochaetae bacterium HGW-Spirochaetae-5]|nr:MAG: hypothetical protein CVV49_07655 [Spirochaetae bacterium HGW-Spirochaetae-5]